MEEHFKSLYYYSPINIDQMKKSIGKFLNASLRRLKEHKEQIKKFRFSSHKEDFVITEQEEREGGFFGSLNFNSPLKLKMN
jgi:hypothetical protein